MELGEGPEHSSPKQTLDGEVEADQHLNTHNQCVTRAIDRDQTDRDINMKDGNARRIADPIRRTLRKLKWICVEFITIALAPFRRNSSALAQKETIPITLGSLLYGPYTLEMILGLASAL